MMCKKPFKKGIMEYGCRQCMPCRVNRSREWVGRMFLESLEHPASCFVTLTYNEENLPADASVHRRDVQLFLKRLRKALAPRRIRFFAVGEYGERTWRPHYHLILFGVSPVEESVISAAWSQGFVSVGTAEKSSMSYVAAYVTKGMTNGKDRRLEGRSAEFSLFSKRPGLGSGVVNRIARSYSTSEGQAALQSSGWFGTKVRSERFDYPLGRYLSKKVQAALGLGPELARRRLRRIVLEVAEKQKGMTVTEYEGRRRAKLEQQEGRLKRKEKYL